ncbi:hypothetical protein Aperf_G00000055365 [Anoplocephala perfoliata]
MALTEAKEQQSRDKHRIRPPACSFNPSTRCRTPMSAAASASPLSLASTKDSSSEPPQRKRPASLCSDTPYDLEFTYHYQLRRRKDSDDYSAIRLSQEHLPSCVAERLKSFETMPIEKFAQEAGVPAPEYVHILENDYTEIENKLLRRNIDPVLYLRRNFGGGTGGSYVCNCSPPTKEELAEGRLACGKDCINRCVLIECDNKCPAYAVCSNRQFQMRLYAPTEPFYCGPHKGWGLKAIADIAKGSFIVEYTGEIIDFEEFKRRVRYYDKNKQTHHYFMSVAPNCVIDSGTKGNWARFVNHSCEPNAITQKWIVKGLPRVGFFAARDIKSGEEITIDYKFVQFGQREQKCYCGAPSCTGIMGSTDIQFRDKVCLRDTRAVERLISKLLTGRTLKSTDDVTNLIQVLLQGYITRYSRRELLNLIIETEDKECLKAFRTYNGLEVLASYMCDTATSDWEMKFKILQCIDHIPVTAQQQVQTNSDLMDFVRQWSIDPRYCKSRSNADIEKHENEGPKSEIVEQPHDVIVNVSNGEAEEEDDDDEDEEEEIKLDGSESNPNFIKVYSPVAEREVVENIRQLASQIHRRWSSLPHKIFRIPRVERKLDEEETGSRSPPFSLVNSLVSSNNEDIYRLWRMSSDEPHRKNNRKRRGRDHRHNKQRNNRGSNFSSQERLSTPEQQARFEAFVIAAETNNSSVVSSRSENEPPTPSIPQKLQDLVEEALHYLADFAGVQSHHLADVREQLLNKLNSVLTNGNDDMGEQFLRKLIEESKGGGTQSESECQWSTAVDRQSGNTYYYNSVTKETRWDPPPKKPLQPSSKECVNRKLFDEIYAYNVNVLKPFRLPNCLTGRLTSDDDLKYVARGFAAKFVKYACSRSMDIGSITLDEKMLKKFRETLIFYMMKHGKIYVRKHHHRKNASRTNGNTNNSLHVEDVQDDGCDMEIDEED